MSAIQTILVVLIGLYFVRTVVGYILSRYYFSRYEHFYSAMDYTPRVSIIKPVYGLDESALDNFRSFCQQDYSHDYEIIFCLENQTDPAVPLIERVIEEYPEQNIRLVFSNPQDSRSFGKIKNMIAGFSESQYEVVIFSDSDVHAPKTFIRDTIGCLKNPKIGLGFSAPVFEGSRDWISAMQNIAVNETIINLAPLCLFGFYDQAIGMTMVTRRKVIEEIGGLEQFGHQVTDDIPLARAIHKKGYRIHLLKEPARIFHFQDNFSRWWSHMHRWLVIIRHYMPALVYSAFFADLPLLLSILYLGISLLRNESVFIGILLVSAVLILRFALTLAINISFAQDKKLWRFIWVIPLWDFLRAPLLIHSSFSNEIVWRGRRIHINSDCSVAIPQT